MGSNSQFVLLGQRRADTTSIYICVYLKYNFYSFLPVTTVLTLKKRIFFIQL